MNFFGVALEGISRFKNFAVNSLANHPLLKRTGRIWYHEPDASLYVSVNDDGLLVPRKLLTNEPLWVDLKAEIDTASATGVSKPVWGQFKGNTEALIFKAGKLQSFQVKYHFDHDYVLGTPVYPHVHFSPLDPLDTGTVRFGFELYVCRGHAQETFSEALTFAIEVPLSSTNKDNIVAEVLEGWYDESMEPDAMVLGFIYRDGEHPNDTAGDIVGLSADIHLLSTGQGTPSRSPDFYAR